MRSVVLTGAGRFFSGGFDLATERAGDDEVARVAGVSRATASRAINGGSRVSASARERVDEAVRTLGYVPNPAARSLASQVSALVPRA